MRYTTEIHTELRNGTWSVQVIRDWPDFFAAAPLHEHVTPASMERLRRWLIAQLGVSPLAGGRPPSRIAMEVAKYEPCLLWDARISYVIERRKP